MPKGPRNYAAEYAKRKARHPNLTPRQAAGHRTRAARVPLFLEGQGRVVQAETDYRTAKRVGKYDNLVRDLQRGRLSDTEFERKVKNWRPVQVKGGGAVPNGSYQFTKSAAEARLLADRVRDDEEELDFDVEGS